MQHTTNYNLNQWEDGDVVRREDFNADNTKIDAALKSVSDASPEIVFGTYTGDGTANRTIDLGRTPRLIFVQTSEGITSFDSYFFGGLATTDFFLKRGDNIFLKIVEGGFLVTLKTGTGACSTNLSNRVYYYVAIF